jgi:hypothetical protein
MHFTELHEKPRNILFLTRVTRYRKYQLIQPDSMWTRIPTDTRQIFGAQDFLQAVRWFVESNYFTMQARYGF